MLIAYVFTQKISRLTPIWDVAHMWGSRYCRAMKSSQEIVSEVVDRFRGAVLMSEVDGISTSIPGRSRQAQNLSYLSIKCII